MRHTLKTIQPFFDALYLGDKTCELRRNDRAFAVGDELELAEWDGANYTGRSISFVVTHVLGAGDGVPGLDPAFVILSITEYETS